MKAVRFYLFSFLLFVLAAWIPLRNVFALAVGGNVGMDLPFSHSSNYDPGIAAEGYYRIDPYEIRFHYGGTQADTYSVLAGIKHFFSADIARPFVEAAIGPVVVNSPNQGLAYGAKSEVTLGLDIGINRYFSTGAVVRYFGMAYFGDTHSGKFEANHGFSLLGTLLVWF